MATQMHHSKKATAKLTAAEKDTLKRLADMCEEEQGTASTDRHRMIAEAAFLIAERRGFQGDKALDGWLQTQAEVDARASARH